MTILATMRTQDVTTINLTGRFNAVQSIKQDKLSTNERSTLSSYGPKEIYRYDYGFNFLLL